MQLYFIPGTLSDRRLFIPQLEAFPDARVLEWVPPIDPKEPLPSYAKRLSGQVDASNPFVLCGVSLGGMLAQEMAQLVKPKGVILVSTASSSKALSKAFLLNGRLANVLPEKVDGALVRLQAKMLEQLIPENIPHRADYLSMIRDYSPELARWQSGAATRWELAAPLQMPVFHIHGEADKIIPLSKIPQPDQVVQGGGHLINLTHADRVNAFIRQSLDRITAAERPAAA